MAKPLDRTQLRGGNKSLNFRGKTFPVGPQTTTFQKPSGSGAIYLSTAGQVFEGYDCRGRDIVINADNVTVRTCLINATSWYPLNNSAGKRGFIAEFNLLDGEKANNQNSAMFNSEAGDSIFRNNVVLDAPTDMVIMCGGTCEHNALAGSFYQTGAHADAFSIGKSLGTMIFRENYVDFTKQPDSPGNANSCIKVVSHFGPIDDVLIENNILIGGGYNMYCGPSPHPVNNVRVINTLYGLAGTGNTADSFIVGGGHSPENGSNFVNQGNALFSDAPNDVVSVVGSGSQPPVEPGSTKPVNTTPPTIVPGQEAGTYTTASGTWSNVQPDWQWAWEWTIDGAPAGSEVVCTPTMNGQLVVAVSATASDGQKTTVPSAPVAVTDSGGDPPTEPPDPDDGGKYLSGDEILTIKESLVTIARIIE